jgi:DNA-binding Lrp family transcriptional regulator
MKNIFSQFDESKVANEKLDEKSKKLLYYLSDNARLSNNELGRLVRLSSEGVRKKISSLEEKNIIWPTGVLNYKYLGYSVYGIFLQLKEIPESQMESFIKFVTTDPRVIEVTEFSDKIDFCIKILIEKMDDASSFVDKLSDVLYDEITDLEIFDIKEFIISKSVPWVYGEGEHFKQIKKQKKSLEPVKLDTIDEQIITQLMKDSRVKITEIKDILKTDMSISNLIYRKKNIEESGLIEAFSAKVDLSYFGIHGYFVLLSLNLASTEAKNEFKRFLIEKPYIIEAFHSIGKWNYIVLLGTQNLKTLHDFIAGTRKHYNERLSNLDVSIVYKRMLFPPPLKIQGK